MADLDAGAVPLGRLREDARRAVVDLIDAVRAVGRGRGGRRPGRPPCRWGAPAHSVPPRPAQPRLLQAPGKKALILEPHVAAWLGLVAEARGAELGSRAGRAAL